MKASEVLNVAGEAGKIALENGAETHRVEAIIDRFCAYYGYSDCDSFVTPTGIMFSISDSNGETTSLIKRINHRTINLEKVSAITLLSRTLQKKQLSITELQERLNEIERIPPYPFILVILGAGLTTGFFTCLFGGKIWEFVFAFVIGCFMKIIGNLISSLKINDFFVNLTGGAFAAFCALASTHFFTFLQTDKIIIGCVMLLVPGLAITNAIRDTIAGDLVAGLSRGIEAFFIAVALALGTGTVMKLWATL